MWVKSNFMSLWLVYFTLDMSLIDSCSLKWPMDRLGLTQASEYIELHCHFDEIFFCWKPISIDLSTIVTIKYCSVQIFWTFFYCFPILEWFSVDWYVFTKTVKRQKIHAGFSACFNWNNCCCCCFTRYFRCVIVWQRLIVLSI